jgi:HpaII restriction endonuclease.
MNDVFFPILKIIRQEIDGNFEYNRRTEIKIYNEKKQEILSIPVNDFVYYSSKLLKELKSLQGRSFEFEELEKFLNKIKVKTIKANNGDKSDIILVIHDLRTGQKPKLGFSIKSMIGGNSTLFNAGKTTNFIFEIINRNFTDLDKDEINSIRESPEIQKRIDAIRQKKSELVFRDLSSSNFKLNLQLIDTKLPDIFAFLVLYKYGFGINKMSELIKKINELNPLSYDFRMGHPFYEHKIKNFLTDSALGMTPSKIWKGKYDATGGIIFVKDDGELLVYHIYNRNEFQNYLISNTKLEQPSTSRYDFGKIYKEKNKYFINLNLQIRFIQ